MENLKFYQITDLHLYAEKAIGSYGKYYEWHCSTDQKCIRESEAIVDAAFEQMAAEKDTEVVIISGDLTCDGEKASHDLLLEKLKKLKEAGKRIYLTFATHDFHNTAKAYTESGEYPIEQYTREQLREIYNDYGWNEAISEHKESTSYSVKVFDGWRFLMMNDDGNGRSFCGYSDDLLDWVKNQVKEAEEAGERLVAVTHHPMLPPAKIYPLFSHRDMLGGYETTATMFADLGIEYVFTGHTHMQSITKIDTVRGNKLYHINTGSVCGYPAPYRKVEITDKGFDVKTVNVETFKWDFGGMDADEYMKEHFISMIRNIFVTMENDIEAFKIYANGFSMDGKTVEALKPILKLLGGFVNSLDFKGFGKLFMIKSKIDETVSNVKVRDFLLEVISNLFSGYRDYSPETAEYKAFMPMIERFGKIIKLKDYFGNKVELKEVFEDLLYVSDGFDNTNAFLPY